MSQPKPTPARDDRARTHIKALATEAKTLTEGTTGTTAMAFGSGMLTGLAASVQILDGDSAEAAMETIVQRLAAVIGNAYVDGTLQPKPTTATPAPDWSTCPAPVDHQPHPWHDPWPLPHGQDAHCPGRPTPEPIKGHAGHGSPCERTPDGSCASPAEPGPSPLRDQIAAALYERERPPRDPHWPDVYAADREVFEGMADAVLAVILPASALADLREHLAAPIDRILGDWPEHNRTDEHEAVRNELLEAVLAVVPAATRIAAGRARDAEAEVQRVVDLYERWVKAGPPPLGAPLARWWDMRLVELREAVLGTKDPS
ncbi:hypothetical protein ACH3XX_09605 [Streptomyces scabiei]|uniref:hypothetical protein n=1 Tax=Streptomyces scabiei TaxID=1930 RepID=UPI0037A078FB